MTEQQSKPDFKERAAQDFRQHSEDLRRPKAERSCTDAAFAVLFLSISVSIAAIGGYFLWSVASGPQLLTQTTQFGSFTKIIKTEFLLRTLVYLLSAMGSSLVLSLLLVWTLQCLPFFASVALGVLGFGGLITLAVINFIYREIRCGAVSVVAVLLLAVLVFCCRRSLRIMIVILRTVSIFLRARSAAFFFPLLTTTVTVLCSVFWLVSLYAAYLLYSRAFLGLTEFALVGAAWLFAAYYHALVGLYAFDFLVAGEVGLWFYCSEMCSLCAPIGWLFKQIGSLSLAALLVAFIKFFQMILSMGSGRGRIRGTAAIVVACCVCMVSCLLRRIEYLLQILNSYSMVVSALTGLSYFDSAYASSSLLLNNTSSFAVLTISNHFIRLGGMFVCSSVPTAASYFLLRTLEFDDSMVLIGSSVVFFFCAIVSLGVLSLVSASMNAMFVYYSLEYEMQQIGLTVEIIQCKDMLELCYSTGFAEEFAPIGQQRCRAASSEISEEPIHRADLPTTHPEPISQIQHNHGNDPYSEKHTHDNRPSKIDVPKIVAYRPSVAPKQIALLFGRNRVSQI